MGFKRTTEPAAEPVTTAEAKTHARVSTTSDDAYIDLLIKAAREQVENWVGQALINQTWTLTLDRFPFFDAAIMVPIPPLASVSGITYVDTAGDTQTLASGNYTVDTSSKVGGKIVPAYSLSWPTTRDVINAVTIAFVAGYGASGASVPESFKLAIKMAVAHWYDNRGEFGQLPESVTRYLNTMRLGF